jgi:hypothetical protein
VKYFLPRHTLAADAEQHWLGPLVAKAQILLLRTPVGFGASANDVFLRQVKARMCTEVFSPSD